MNKINELILQLEKKQSVSDKENKAVSLKPVSWHLQHSLLVIQQICYALQNSNPTEYKWRFNFWRLVVMGKNKITRGKGKAPSRVLPKEEITAELLAETFAKTKQDVVKLTNLQANHFFNHPFFGDLNLKPSKKFIALHTQHHLDIIEDILKTSK